MTLSNTINCCCNSIRVSGHTVWGDSYVGIPSSKEDLIVIL